MLLLSLISLNDLKTIQNTNLYLTLTPTTSPKPKIHDQVKTELMKSNETLRKMINVDQSLI